MNSISLANSVSWPVELSVLLLVTLAMLSDLRARKIPNRLLAVALVVALLEQCWQHGVMDGGLAWLGGCLVGMVLLVPGYLLRMMGAGDVKLLGTVGAFFGVLGAVQIGLVSCVFGGLYGLMMMIRQRQVRAGLVNSKWMLFSAAQIFGSSLKRSESAPATIGRIPYAVAIALGTACVLCVSR